METQKLSKKVVPKMDAQKLSKKVVPKMEAQKLSKKSGSQNGNPKTFQNERDERGKNGHVMCCHSGTFGNIMCCHQALAWILGPWFLSWRYFWYVLLGPRDFIFNLFLLITCWAISSLGILAQKPFAVIIFIWGHAFYHGVSPGILASAFWPQTSWILSQNLA